MHTLSPLPLNWKDNIVCTFDRAAVNYCTFESLKGIAPSATDIGCMSHTFSQVGEKAELPIVKVVVECLTTAGYSGHARNTFVAVYKEAIKRHSNVRWYCEFEQAHQQFLCFPCLKTWVLQCEHAGLISQTIAKTKTYCK